MMVNMTKIAKNEKKPRPGSDKAADDASGECADWAPKNASLFKSRPHGDDDFDPLDLVNSPEDCGQDDLHPSALGDQGTRTQSTPASGPIPVALPLKCGPPGS